MAKKDWTNKGKTVSGLIQELQTFENQELEVRISIDDGKTSFPISIVEKESGKYALLTNCEKSRQSSIMIKRKPNYVFNRTR